MRNLFAICLPFLLFVACGKATENKPTSSILKSDIECIFASEKGDFALAFLPLYNHEDSILINATETFHAASTMKTPVMLEVFKQVDAGRLDLYDSILIKNNFYSIVDSSEYIIDEDSENQLYEMVGDSLPLYDVMYKMIIESSNLGTNLIVELVNAKNVTQTMRSLGAPYINVLRGVQDLKAFDRGLSNSTTAFDLMVLYEKIAEGEAVSKAASDKMIEILLDQKYNDMIPAQLPKEVKVAHKTGEITGVRHDSGIVMLPDGRKYVLVLLSKNLEDAESGIQKMAEISKMIYDFVMHSSV
ncbi:MAG: serine hydrolase [Bacteroidota bacterium]